MDTVTHLSTGAIIGFTFTNIYPNLNRTEILAVALVSSIINDLDTIVKIKGNPSFIMHHRRSTHLLLTAPLISLLIPFISLFYKNLLSTYLILFMISIISILIHLFLDCLNSYGTELFLNRKPIRLAVLNTFDPLLLIINIGICLSLILNHDSNYYILFIPLYYIFIRFIFQYLIRKRIKKKYNMQKVYVMATMNIFSWDVIIDDDTNLNYQVGKYVYKLKIYKTFPKKCLPENYLSIIKFSNIYKAFTKISFAYYWQIIIHPLYYEIKLIDLKYHIKKDHFYFKAIFYISDNKLNKAYLGWVRSDKKLYHKLM